MLNKESAKLVLWLASTVLKDMGITHWIDSGTLLSAYRDGDINQYDHDIDIRTYVEQFPDDAVAELVKRFWLAGFRCVEGNKPIKAQLLVWHPLDVILDLKLCYHDKEYLWYYCWDEPNPIPMLHVYPIKFFEELGEIELFGVKYPCPVPVEEYIEYHYGPEWRLFKVRADEADDTDLAWDHMHSPLCSMTQEEFKKMKEKIHA